MSWQIKSKILKFLHIIIVMYVFLYFENVLRFFFYFQYYIKWKNKVIKLVSIYSLYFISYIFLLYIYNWKKSCGGNCPHSPIRAFAITL